MKKFILSLVAMFTIIISANAQYNVSGHRFFDNWSIGTDGGVTTNLHDWDKPNGAVWGIQITKDITPVFSLEFADAMGFNNNTNWNEQSLHSYNGIDNFALFSSAKVNISNWWFGYNGRPRVFELKARAGVGYMRTFYPNEHSRDNNSSLAKLGLDFDFNMGKARAWTFSVRPAVVMKGHKYDTFCDNDNRCTKYGHNCVGQLTAGITYHFKTSNGKHHFTNVEPVEVTKIIETVVEKPVEVVKVEHKHEITTVMGRCVVQFEKNKATISEQDKSAVIGMLQASGAKNVSVVAYSSPEGNPDYNMTLSQRRADAVRDFLINRGYNVLQCVGCGAPDITSNRIAIVTVMD